MENIELNDVYNRWREISDQQISDWTLMENLEKRNERVFNGFKIVDSIDGGVDENVEISLVEINQDGVYPQHVHKKSDAYFIIVEGQAYMLSGDNKSLVIKGERIEIPRGMPHGFELSENSFLKFISIQSPPIRDRETGEEDFHSLTQVI